MLLKLINVSKIYQMGENLVHALDHINLFIQKGESLSIMGPSGSGKSTLMHIIGCLDTPTEGKVVFEGKDLSKLNEVALARIRNQKIGFVFQTFNLLRRTTVLDNVCLPLIYTSLNNVHQESIQAKKLLEIVGLEKRIDHLPSQLSGGEQQRVAIARALVNNPAIVLADEPTGNLDSKSGQGIMELLKELNRKGHTIIVVTHDPEVAKYAKRIIRIKDGKIE